MNRMGDPNVTENKVEPATDEEIETAQRLSALNIACPPWDVLALIARIDAECTRADEAETRVEEIELDAEKVAAEFEGDANKALGRPRSEERRVGKGGGRACRFRWGPYQ